MTWAAVAIGGSAAVGAGVGLTGAFMGQSAAKDAASSQQQGLWAGIETQRGTTAQMLQYFDPFRQMGLAAGRALTQELYSPSQQIAQAQSTITELQGKLSSLQALRDKYRQGIGIPTLTGKNASEKRKPIWDQMLEDNDQQQQQLQQQIDQQKQMLAEAQQNAANPNYLSDMITQNPMYTAGANVVSRRLAAQGLQGSQEAIRQEGTLAANVFQNQIANQLGIYQPTVGQAGQMATNIMASGQQQAQMLGAVGQSQAQGKLNANEALWGGIGNATNSLTSGAGAMLNYNMYNNLIGALGTKQTGPSGSNNSNTASNATVPSGPAPLSALSNKDWGLE